MRILKILVQIVLKRNEVLELSDILLKINCPTLEEISKLKENTILIGNFFPHLIKKLLIN